MELDLHLTSLPGNLFAHESLTITGPQAAVELGYSIILLYMVQCLGLLQNSHPSSEMLQNLLLMAKETWHILLFLCTLLHS